ncbi:MAG: ribonuclease M5 [Firmicutes bacterium]|nr:ribonuclease M5 [Bacillota bacterium]
MITLPEIGEVIVVEGQSDRQQVLKAVRADVLVTGGSRIRKEVYARLQRVAKARGIIILTDPDFAGGQIRRQLTDRFPEALHAYIPREQATSEGDVGVENTRPELIASALLHVRKPGSDRLPARFSWDDMTACGLAGAPGAATRREQLGAALGIGYGNAKAFLNRLNALNVTREEWEAAIAKLEVGPS